MQLDNQLDTLPTCVEEYPTFIIRPMTPADISQAGQIMFHSFNTQNQHLGLPPEWPSVEFTTGLIGMLQANPNFLSVVAVDKQTTQVIGSNFLEKGDVVTAPGPISVDNNGQNAGVGRALMEYVIAASKEQGQHNIRLVQVANNLKSFSLYASQGFRFGEVLTMIAGKADTSLAEQYIDAGYCLVPLAEEHILACDQLHIQANLFSRAVDIAGALHPLSPHQPFALLQAGELIAYTTGLFLLGHSVAKSEEAFKALYCLGSQQTDNPLFHLPSRVYQDLLYWALREAKLRVVRQEILMYMGEYATPHHQLIYLPGMAY
jgi:predicted N-acetyltransferase YhbS